MTIALRPPSTMLRTASVADISAASHGDFFEIFLVFMIFLYNSYLNSYIVCSALNYEWRNQRSKKGKGINVKKERIQEKR